MRALFLILLLSGAAFAAGAKTIQVKVNGMVCGLCARGISKKLSAEASVESVDVKLEQKTVTVVLRDGKTLSDDRLTEILKDSGYDVEKINRN